MTGVEVDVKDADMVGFLNAERIHDQLGTTRLEGELMADVDLQSVVNHLHDLDACADAEVYPTMNGVLHIDVWQRRPVMRVHLPEGGPDYYLDEDGRRLVLDPHFTPAHPRDARDPRNASHHGLPLCERPPKTTLSGTPSWTSSP